MTFKIMAQSIRWIEKDSVFRMVNYKKRTIVGDEEYLEQDNARDTLFDFEIQDLAPLNYKAETLTMFELNDFIASEERSGSVLINQHLLVRHKRYSLPVSAFILTLIAVAVSSFKRRGDGVNLAFGIALGFIFIFFDKIFWGYGGQIEFFTCPSGMATITHFLFFSHWAVKLCKTLEPGV